MNKNRYRVIFSQARGVFIAVAEIVKSRTKTVGQSSATETHDDASQITLNSYKKLNPLNFAVIAVLGAVVYSLPLNSIANTQIIADKSAPNSQQATILNSSNGLTQVNIQTPSAGGVSRNTYTQFDVGQEGAILNNSRNNTQTQLGGWVQGNPWLANGEAKVILNEVNSSNPSQLKGYLEVAGKSAQVVIANPSGLVCDGCGVINADRFTLTSGQAVMNQGYLESFRVRDGQVTIEGKGLDGSLTPYTDIYTRALNVNAGLYANNLNVALGQNDIHVKDQVMPQINTATANLSTNPNKPNFALDVGQLGGMYAGKIFLVGNENGLGVRNAGSINATTDQLTLMTNGDLVNAGNMIANKDQVQLKAQNIQNSGNISSATSQVTIQSQNLDNSGLISSADELHLQNQNALTNTGKLNAARIVLDSDRLKNSGSIEQTGLEALDLKAGQMSNAGGKIGVPKTPEGGSSGEGATEPTVPTDPSKDGGSLEAATPTETTPKTYDAGYIHVKNIFNNDQGAIVANGGVDLESNNGLNNQGGQLNLGTVNVKGDSFNNDQGKLTVTQADIQTTGFSNQQGELASNQKLNIQSQTANNQQGKIQSVDQLDLNIANELDNTEGQIASNATVNVNADKINNQSGVIYSEQQAVNVQAKQAIDNTSGLIQAKTDLNLSSQSLNNTSGQILADQIVQQHSSVNNTQGTIAANKNLKSTVGQFDNTQGQVQAQNLQLHHQQLNNTGSIYADQNLSLTGQDLKNAGSLAAGQNIQITSSSLNQTADGLIAAGLDREGKLTDKGDLSIQADQAELHGQSFAGNQLNVQAKNDIDASQGQLQAKNITIESQTGNISTQAATVVAQDQLKLTSQNVINNHQGQLSAKDLLLNAKQLDNSQGKIQHVGSNDLNLNFTNGLNNQSGEIQSNARSIYLTTSNLNNESGKLIHAGDRNFKISATNIQGTDGQILSNGTLAIDAGQLVLDGATTSADQITINADRLSHQKGQMIQNGQTSPLSLTIKQDLNNQQGIIAGQNGLNISADLANNQAGQLLSGIGDLSLNVQNALDNRQAGQIVSDANSSLQVGSLSNSEKGQISAQNALTIQSLGLIDNQTGQIVANQDVLIQSEGLDNTSGQIGTSQGKLEIDTGSAELKNDSGTIQAEKALTIDTNRISNQSGLINGQDLLKLTSQKDIDNTAGQIISNQNVSLQSQGLRNDAGQIGSVHGDVVLDAGTADLSNQSGKIQSAQDLTLKAQNIQNQSGLISAQNHLDLHTQNLENQKGQIQSGDAIDIAGQHLNNQGGSILTNSSLTLNIDGLLDNSQAGALSSGLSADIKAGSLDNSGKGQINAQDSLNITSKQSVNNQTGNIVANNHVSISSQGLDNTQGQIGSVKGQLDLDVGQGEFKNISGSLQAGSHLNLNSNGLNNDAGQIIALGDSYINSTGDISNKSGQILANGTANISSQNLNNQAGQIQSGEKSNLTLTINGKLDNSQKGQIHSENDLSIQSQQLDNSQQGQISAQNALEIKNAGQLSNQSGQILANESVHIQSQGLNNTQGQIASIQSHVDVDAGNAALSNQSGLLQAKTDLIAKAGNIDNSAGQISGQGKVDLNSQQAINNQKGVIAGDQSINLYSQGINNNQGQIGTQGNLTVNAGTQALQNQTGVIQSGQDIQINAGNLDNTASGQISAQGALNAAIDAEINNTTGLIAANQNVSLNSQGLNNTEGKIGSVNGDLLVNTGSRELNNQSGSLQSSHLVNIKANGINNQSGQIVGLKEVSLDSQAQQLSNQQGVISSDQIDISSGQLNNDQGLIQANHGINIDTHHQDLINTQSGKQGGILSQGNVTLNNVARLDNTQGYIASGNALAINANQIQNKSGLVTAAENVKIQGIGQNQVLNNQSGQISSMGNMQLNIDQINNQGKQNPSDANSQIIASKTLTIQAKQLDNQNSQSNDVEVQGINAGNLDLTANIVNNQAGEIRSSQDAHLNISTQFNNQAGQVSAVSALNIKGDSLNIDNAQGQMLAGENLNLTAQSLTGNGKVLSLGDAKIELKQGYQLAAGGQLQANHNLSLSTEEDIENDGKITAGNTLSLTAKNINNSLDASIESHDTNLTASQQINNTGLINGDYTTLKADTINNQGTGRIYGTDLAIEANTLNNLPDTSGKAPIIASRGDMNLGVKTLNNLANTTDYTSQAQIFSAGGLYLGGALDENRKAIGQADVINNESATIESLGDMQLSAKQINNINKNFSTEDVKINEGFDLFAGYDGGWHNVDGTVISLENAANRFTNYRYNDWTEQTKVVNSAPAKITAGGNMDLSGAYVFNDKSQIIVGGELKNVGGSINSPKVEGTEKYFAEGSRVLYEIRSGKDKKTWEDFTYSKEKPIDLNISQVIDHQKINQENKSINDVSNDQSQETVSNGKNANSDIKSVDQKDNTTRVDQTGSSQNKDLNIQDQGSVQTDLNNTNNNHNVDQINAQNNSTSVIDAEHKTGQSAEQIQAGTKQDQTAAPDQAGSGEAFEIRTINGQQVKVPNNALYRVSADKKAGYLIETDPAFTNYKKWLSSDYMLDALGLDPALQQKRIGDGFYEQRMVQDQIANLTGYRFLEGYASDEEQYKALMNNGVTYGKLYGLQPGIALTAAQIAQLTSDIVWLVEKNVTLADGTVTKALVPQVYVKARVGDLKGDGSLLTGNSVNFSLNGDLLNGATIAGRNAVQITADNVTNLSGRIQGNTVAITTKNDLNNIGGQISANEEMALKVGGNLNISTTTITSDSQHGNASSSTTGIGRIAGLYVGNGSNTIIDPNKVTLAIDVAGNSVLKGAEIGNLNGATVLNTVGHVDIGTVQIGQSDKRPITGKSGFSFETKQDVGSQISSVGSVIVAGQNITGTAVNLSSQQGNVELLAQKDITLENGLNERSVYSKDTTTGSLGSKTLSTFTENQSTSIANQINAGQNVILNSQQGDVTATHLQAQAGNNIQIHADNGNVNLLSTIDETSVSSTSNKKNFATFKNQQQGYIDQEVAQTQLIAGNSVDINAGKNIELQANAVQAGQSIYVGNTLMQRQADGTLKSVDGSIMPENVTLSTLETHDQEWDETQKGYRGVVKDIVKVAAVGLAGIEALAPGLKAPKVTISESSSQRTEEINQTGSNLKADNVFIGSAGQTTLTSSDINAKNTTLSGQTVILNAAEEQHIRVESKSKETVQGLGAKLNNDSIRLGGFVNEQGSQSNKTTEITHKAGNINTENLMIQGDNGVDILGQNIKATADTTIDHGRGNLNIAGYEDKTITEDQTHKTTISTEVGVRNAYVDAVLAVGAVGDAAKAVSQAKDNYSQAQRDYAAGKITKEALEDSKANVAMAITNLTSAQIAVGVAAANAAANSATYGFTIGANGQRVENTETSTTETSKWLGSNLDLNNVKLKSEGQDINIQGSRLTATGTTTFDGTKDLNVTAGTERTKQDTGSKTNTQSVSYTSGGGGSVSIGKQNSQSHSESLTHVNSDVELNKVSGAMDKLNIQGGTVSIADRGDLKVNEIHVESLQDTASSSSSSKGGSIGAGFGTTGGLSNVTAGYNHSNGKSDSAWVNETSTLIIGNAQNDADLDAMGVKKVSNIGGVIANASKNEDGTLTDHGKLNYTGTLDLQDIQDHRSESNRGFNILTNIGTPIKGQDENSSKFPSGSTTVGLQSTGNETEQLTKATMGQGTVTNVTDGTNRDINQNHEITRDQVTGMLDGSVTVDHRLLTESGRAEIVQQQKDIPENFRQSAENLAKALPDGAYKDKAIQTLNNIQASLANNPEMLAKGGDEVYKGYKEFIRQGGEPEQYEAIFDQEVLPLAKELNDVAKHASDDIKKELAKYYGIDESQAASVAKTLLVTRQNEQNGSASHDSEYISSDSSNDCSDCLHLEISKAPSRGSQILVSDTPTYKITLENGKDIYFETGSNLAIKIFDKSAAVSYKVDEAIKKTGVDPQLAGLALSLAFGGPIGLAKGLITDAVAGTEIATGVDILKNQVTAVVRESDRETVSQLTTEKLQQKGGVSTEQVSEQVQRTKDGVGFLASVIGVGGGAVIGKGIAKGKDGESSNISEQNRGELTKPYDPMQTRSDLESVNGAENVKSTTVVNNPIQRVNSNPEKGIEVVYDSYGNKAVKAEYRDPLTGESKIANVAYDSRGLPIFDNYSKYTTTIDTNLSYPRQMAQATRDLRDAINSGKVNTSGFTSQQLKQIQAGSAQIDGYTWHHNAQSAPNVFQLLPKEIHDAALHIGQGSLSGGK